MKNETPRKVAKKVAKLPKTPKVIEEVKIPTYHITMNFNGDTHQIETDNLEEAILSVKPVFLKTKIYILIKKGDEYFEKTLFVNKGKMLFRNKIFLQFFIRKLIFK